MPARKRRRALAAVVVVFAGLGAVGCGPGGAPPAACQGLDQVETPGFALSMADDECVGWTNEQSYAFSPEVKDVVARIAAQNEVVKRRGEQADGSRGPIDYVRIGVLMPMTSGPGSAMTEKAIPRALNGILTAQVRANDLERADFRPANTLGVQVVLLNEGRNQDHSAKVIEQLVRMTGEEHPLVAVVGMGPSGQRTLDDARELEKYHIAAIGDVSSTDMVWDNFFKVSPSNADYVTALDEYLTPPPAGGLLVQDNNKDPYVTTLGEALTEKFGKRYRFDQRTRWFAGSRQPSQATPAVFGPVADAVCEYDSDVVFFAGRERDLPALVAALAGHPCRNDKRRYVATGTTGVGLTQGDGAVLANLDRANLRLIAASDSDAQAWGDAGRANRAPKNYAQFHSRYLALGLAEGDLIDGYSISFHDALASAVFATRQAAENLGKPPAPGDVLLQLKNLRNATNPVPAAGGDLTFGAGGWPVGKLAPIVLVPQEPVTAPVHITGRT
ncbi:hypothetical protein ACWEGE_30025 [Amycolatopsis sp. NPDC004747]